MLLLRYCLSKNLLCYSLERAGHSSGSGLGQLISWPIGHGWKSHVKDLEGLVTFNEQPSLTDLRRSVQPKVTPKKVHTTHTYNKQHIFNSLDVDNRKKTHIFQPPNVRRKNMKRARQAVNWEMKVQRKDLAVQYGDKVTRIHCCCCSCCCRHI